VKRRLRLLLRRCGLDVFSNDVVCPEHVKTIQVDANWSAVVTVRRALVFLDLPEASDLRDTFPIDSETDLERFSYVSPDSREVSRALIRRNDLAIQWEPLQSITRYALFTHQYSWRPAGSYGQAAWYTELRCDTRTGILALEIVTPGVFENAVVFMRPRWSRLNTERRLVRYALSQLGSDGARPVIGDNGRRVEVRVSEPKVGGRYVCVVFHEHGVEHWRERLAATSIISRVRRLISQLVPA
jgi:hypothetical protein